MNLFDKIPERLFSILVSSKKELYVQALFVLREAFRTELRIRREDFTSMLMDSLEEDFKEADFSEEAQEEGESEEEAAPVSGKAHLLVRKLRDTGWIEVEFDPYSFEEYINVPDYAVSVMNLLYELSEEKTSEYTSFVYASYAALKNAHENKEFQFQALKSAYDNTVRLLTEMKSLYNSIHSYFQTITQTADPNEVLKQHFDGYQREVVDGFIFPLKTLDSIGRFKQSIIDIVQEWSFQDWIRDSIVSQGIKAKVFKSEEQGQEKIDEMITFLVDTYRDIDYISDQIDARHQSYVNAMAQHFQYLVNADRGVKGNLTALLKRSGEEKVSRRMEEALELTRHQYLDEKSFFAKKKRTKRSEGTPLAVPKREEDPSVLKSFLKTVNELYTTEKIEDYVFSCMGDGEKVTTMECRMEGNEDFILFFLATIRGTEEKSPYKVIFPSGERVYKGDYELPQLEFVRREKRKR